MSDKQHGEQAQEPDAGVVLTPEQQRSRRSRNIAIGLAVTLLAVLFYAVTIVRLGGAVASRTI
ncbi:MAG: hypothetical protein EB015_03075 [Methylocystaceae bacterium]|jgi:hypothetical protein|nr:hypothetical protein [Methylocystaceae bacterium]